MGQSRDLKSVCPKRNAGSTPALGTTRRSPIALLTRSCSSERSSHVTTKAQNLGSSASLQRTGKGYSTDRNQRCPPLRKAEQVLVTSIPSRDACPLVSDIQRGSRLHGDGNYYRQTWKMRPSTGIEYSLDF